MTADPLEALLVDESSIARDELATALAPFVQLTRDGGMIPTERFAQLSAAEKLLATLLSLVAHRLLGNRAGDAAKPAELARLTGLPTGTVHPTLSELARKHKVAKQADGYYLPRAAMRSAGAQLRGRLAHD